MIALPPSTPSAIIAYLKNDQAHSFAGGRRYAYLKALREKDQADPNDTDGTNASDDPAYLNTMYCREAEAARNAAHELDVTLTLGTIEVGEPVSQVYALDAYGVQKITIAFKDWQNIAANAAAKCR